MERRSFRATAGRRATAEAPRGIDGTARATTGTGATIAAALLLAACGSDSDPAGTPAPGVTTTIDTVGSAVRVTNGGSPPEWRLTRVASIGPQSLSGAGSPDEFGRIYDVALGPDDAVFVADGMNSEVRVFGVDGVHRRTFGRDGEGPGEFARLYSVAWLGDRLLALDSQQGRISEFSAEGEYLGQRRIQGGLSGGSGWVRFWPVGADEAYHVTLSSVPGRSWEFVGVDSRGETGDTLLQLEGPNSPSINCERGGSIHFFGIPFATKLVQRPGSGGVMYSAMTGDYRIAVTRANGDTVRVIERSLPAEPISDEEWSEGNSDYLALRDSLPLIVCDPLRPPRPDAKPFIEAIDIAYDGTLWVEVIREAGNRWEVFDAQGRLMGSMPAPTERRAFTPPAIGADHVLTVRRGDFDLDYVDVWRIEREGAR